MARSLACVPGVTSCAGRICGNTHVWEPWTKCTLPCGGGHRIRTRNVVVRRAGGVQPACTTQVQLGTCNTHVCTNKYVGMELQRLRGKAQRKARSRCEAFNVLGRWSQCTARCGGGSREHGVRYRMRGHHVCMSTGRPLLRTWRQIEPCSSASADCQHAPAADKISKALSAPPLTRADLEHSKWLATFQPPKLRPKTLALDEHAASPGSGRQR